MIIGLPAVSMYPQIQSWNTDAWTSLVHADSVDLSVLQLIMGSTDDFKVGSVPSHVSIMHHSSSTQRCMLAFPLIQFALPTICVHGDGLPFCCCCFSLFFLLIQLALPDTSDHCKLCPPLPLSNLHTQSYILAFNTCATCKNKQTLQHCSLLYTHLFQLPLL